jgi:hypothetical protein
MSLKAAFPTTYFHLYHFFHPHNLDQSTRKRTMCNFYHMFRQGKHTTAATTTRHGASLHVAHDVTTASGTAPTKKIATNTEHEQRLRREKLQEDLDRGSAIAFCAQRG